MRLKYRGLQPVSDITGWINDVRGMTLIEVLLALTLMGVVLVPALGFMVNYSGVIYSLKNRNQALLRGQRLMEEQLARDYEELIPGVYPDTYSPDGYPQFEEEITVIEQTSFKEIAVSLSWGQPEKQINFRSRVYK